ncbi:hypothetical protein RAS1_38200 [Phycisphaerae bacterium RAS1]|nr:hypothetical protein RAS1_38200 [Phycisphaerae bacterium RAS1]
MSYQPLSDSCSSQPGLSVPASPCGTQNPACLAERLVGVTEFLALLVIGWLLMHYLCTDTKGPNGADLGLPGFDSWYHARMSSMLPEVGLVREFPWLRFSYFTRTGHDFVSHHYGFHVMMLPFIKASEHFLGDAAPGARWAICTTFGVNLALFNLLLKAGGVRWRLLWLALILLMPHQFIMRSAHIRAIGPSLMFLMLITWLMFKRRPILTGLAIASYTHLYLGAVMYAPIIVATYAAAAAVGPAGQRHMPWKLVLITAGFWFLGVLTYPYAGGMLEFLRLQVFGTGLTPDIEVGGEWKPYEGVWWFTQMSAALLIVWTTAVVLRMRLGPNLDEKETTLLLLNFFFLLLTLKARRFVEYWPAFGLLSAAYMLAPVLSPLIERLERGWRSDEPQRGEVLRRVIIATLVTGAVALCGLGFFGGVAKFLLGDPRLTTVFGLAVVVTALGAAVGFLVRRLELWVVPVRTVLAAACLSAVGFGYPQWTEIRKSLRCGYDLKALRETMAYVREHSQPGDVIFTDDWDIFPVYFYHNTYNNYIVGLDPKFTHERRPDLWQRFVKITRGQTPCDITEPTPDENGKLVKKKLHVDLIDVREQFGAKWVITDRDHRSLANKLAKAKDIAELVYPVTSMSEAGEAEFLVFRVIWPEGRPAQGL